MRLLKFLDGTFLMIGLSVRYHWRRLRGQPGVFEPYVDKADLKKWAELSRKKERQQ
jgi:hypothetical protein